MKTTRRILVRDVGGTHASAAGSFEEDTLGDPYKRISQLSCS